MTKRNKVPAEVVNSIAYEATVVKGKGLNISRHRLNKTKLTSLIRLINIWLADGYDLEGDVEEVSCKRIVLTETLEDWE